MFDAYLCIDSFELRPECKKRVYSLFVNSGSWDFVVDDEGNVHAESLISGEILDFLFLAPSLNCETCLSPGLRYNEIIETIPDRLLDHEIEDLKDAVPDLAELLISAFVDRQEQKAKTN